MAVREEQGRQLASSAARHVELAQMTLDAGGPGGMEISSAGMAQAIAAPLPGVQGPALAATVPPPDSGPPADPAVAAAALAQFRANAATTLAEQAALQQAALHQARITAGASAAAEAAAQAAGLVVAQVPLAQRDAAEQAAAVAAAAAIEAMSEAGVAVQAAEGATDAAMAGVEETEAAEAALAQAAGEVPHHAPSHSPRPSNPRGAQGRPTHTIDAHIQP